MWNVGKPTHRSIAILWSQQNGHLWLQVTDTLRHSKYPTLPQWPNHLGVVSFRNFSHPPALTVSWGWFSMHPLSVTYIFFKNNCWISVFAKYVDPPAWSQPDPKIWGASILNHHQLVISNAKKQMPGSDSWGSTETSLPKPVELSL